MEMRLTENLNQLRQPVGNRFEIFIGPVPGPALPTWTKVNREDPWPFRPSAWFFHSLACVGCFSPLVSFELESVRIPARRNLQSKSQPGATPRFGPPKQYQCPHP